jgi:lipoprotein-anchoring transpeptidase ErfK/SrfK
VRNLQRRLSALGYWLGAVDGRFGNLTQQAVYALQKAAALSRDGAVGVATAFALARGVRPRARTTSGSAVEIDLRRDLLMIVRDGKLATILNTSTGGGYSYTSGGVTSVARTPQGVFTVFRQVDGLDVSPLGELWRPKYFAGGYAIHGSASVPPFPVSHGCVRLSNQAMDWIWATNRMPIGIRVWIYH